MAYGQFRDVFVDALASGTTSGDSPTDAIIKLGNNSIFTTDVASSMIRAWVRRTHVETIIGDTDIGANNFNHTSSRRQFIIGWPNSGDPFFDERPNAGILAGWDSDASARAVNTTYGFNFPTITGSGGGRLRFKKGTIIANMNFDQVASNDIGQTVITFADPTVYATNIVFTNRDGPTMKLLLASNAAWRWGRLHVINTPSGPAFSSINSFNVEQVVIHSMSACASGAFQPSGNGHTWYIGDLINHSNSVDYFFGSFDRPASCGEGQVITNYVERIRGIQPYSGYRGLVGPFQQNGTFNGLLRVDDYLGEGPFFSSGPLGPHMHLATSAEAMYESARAVLVECSSRGGGWPQYGLQNPYMKPVKKYFDVLSGQPVTIFQPVYVTGPWSLANGTAVTKLRADGCMLTHITASHMITGSLTSWAGSKKTGGAAWTIATTFTPEESGRVLYETCIPVLVLSGDMGTEAYMLYGEPWAV